MKFDDILMRCKCWSTYKNIVEFNSVVGLFLWVKNPGMKPVGMIPLLTANLFVNGENNRHQQSGQANSRTKHNNYFKENHLKKEKFNN